MKINLYLKIAKWMASSLSLITMVWSPVAMGLEAQKISQAQLEEAVKSAGLNRQITLREFYNKNKDVIPDRLKPQFEAMVKIGGNQLLPEVEIVSSKGTLGETIPTLRLSQGGELINIQWFGEKNKVLKIQNTTLSQIDLINFEDAFVRVAAGDAKYNKQMSPPAFDRMATKFSYPDVTPDQWNKMTDLSRAQYMLNLRTVWQDAKQVLQYAQKKNKKTSQNFNEKYEFFVKLFGGEEAMAADDDDSETPKGYAKECVVAGYLSKYRKTSKGIMCSIELISTRHGKKPFVELAEKKRNELVAKGGVETQGCAKDSVICNPYIYGAPGGNPICMDPKAPYFQHATHFSLPDRMAGKTCDTESRLQTSDKAIPFLKPECANRQKGRYGDDCRLPVNLDEEFKKDQDKNKELTEKYLLGIAKLKGIDTSGKKISDLLKDSAALEVFKSVKTEFEREINEARQACASVADNQKYEKNFWPACDQLHRRFLFFDQTLKLNCEAGGLSYDPSASACSCPLAPPAAATPAAPVAPPAAMTPAPAASPAIPIVRPAPTVPVGAICPRGPGGGSQDSAAPGTSETPRTASDTNSCNPDMSNGPNCTCASGSKPDVTKGNPKGICSIDQREDDPADPGKVKEECGFLCKLWKGVKKFAPIILGVTVAIVLWNKLLPKKKGISAPAGTCPNGSVPPCAQECKPPLKLQGNGTCSCDGCPEGQSPNAQCTCENSSSGGGTTQILCPDSVTRAVKLEQCPDYPCWNGQSYKNPIHCPPAPSPSPAAPAGYSK